MKDETKTEKLRTFFAIMLPEKTQETVARFTADFQTKKTFQRLRWSESEKLHITLRFLGDITAQQVNEIKELVALEMQKFSPFDLNLTKLSLFPSTQAPRTMIMEPRPITPVVALALVLERIVVEYGLTPEKRTFRPHLTLARMHGKPYPELDKKLKLPDLEFEVREIELMRSQLTPDGSVYSTLVRIPLVN